VGDRLDDADALLRAGEYDSASAVYATIASAEEGTYSPPLVKRAREGQAEVERSRAAAARSPRWDRVKAWKPMASLVNTWQELLNLVFSLLPILLVVAIVMLVRRVRGTRRDTLIDVDDLTVDTAQRTEAKRRLCQELSLAIRRIGDQSSRSATDQREDLDGIQAVNARLRLPIVKHEGAMVANESPVRVGPIQVTVGQLLALGRAVFTRPFERTIAGHLSTDDAQTGLYLELRDRRGRILTVWTATHPKKNARAEVLREIAAPDPYVGLAAAYLRLQERADPQWRLQADCALKRAAKLSPFNGKVYYYLGRLAEEREDFAEAKEHFTRAAELEPHPWTLFRHARLLASQEEAYEEAIRLLQRSIDALPRPDERYWAFARYTLDLARKGKVDGARIARAREYAEALATRGLPESLRPEAAQLLTHLSDVAEGKKIPALPMAKSPRPPGSPAAPSPRASRSARPRRGAGRAP
jgi:Tfp pilus assembly protein PilF